MIFRLPDRPEALFVIDDVENDVGGGVYTIYFGSAHVASTRRTEPFEKPIANSSPK